MKIYNIKIKIVSLEEYKAAVDDVKAKAEALAEAVKRLSEIDMKVEADPGQEEGAGQ